MKAAFKFTPALVIGAFAILYCLISLVNHYLFRTAALDLGLYTHTLYDYAHFRFNNSLLIEPLFRFRNQLGDHFDLMLMLLSPLYWVFGTYTLLLVQIAAILFGGYGVFLFIKEKDPKIALWAMIHFYCIWGIYSALAFDYHSNVVGAMFVPWVLLFWKRKNKRKAILFTLLTILCKENLALWMGFIWLALAWESRRDKSFRTTALVISICSFIYFVFILKVVMPLLAPSGENYIHFFFKGLGNTPGEALLFIFRHPIDVVKLFFFDPQNLEISRSIKQELHTFILLSGGVALLFRPRYLLMLIPIYAQKLLHDDYVKWGIYHHYSIEFAPVLSIALFSLIADLKYQKIRLPLAILCIATTMLVTRSSFAVRHSRWFDPVLGNPFIAAHYKQSFDVQHLHSILNQIPVDLKVCASTRIVPHLANRRYIYCYPFLMADIDLIILFKNPDTVYPCKQTADYFNGIDELRKSSLYTVSYEDNDILCFSRQDVSLEPSYEDRDDTGIFKKLFNNKN